MKITMLVVLLIMVFSVSAQAEDSNTLRMLVSDCSKFLAFDAQPLISDKDLLSKDLPSVTDSFAIGYCAGYVNAAMQFIGAFVPTICLPATVTAGDLIKIIVKY